MKQKISLLSAFIFSLVFIFTACKKDSNSGSNNSNVDVQTHSDDQSLVSDGVDAITDDGDAALESSIDYSGRHQESETLFCDASVTLNLESNPRTITITYDGSNCRGTYTRKGVVVLSIPQSVKWQDSGAVVNVSYQNLKITRTSDNKSIVLNGEQVFTNTTGGLLSQLAQEKNITHRIESTDLSITFDNGAVRSWQIDEQRAFTYDNGIVAAVSGLHTEGNDTHIAQWGTNRFGISFATSTVEPLIIRQDCNFRLTGGTLKHTVGNVSATATFGLDAEGIPVSCPEGHYYYKLVYTGPKGNSITLILPY